MEYINNTNNMKYTRLNMALTCATILPLLLITTASTQGAFTVVSLNDITPGTETTTLIPNGDYEAGIGNENPDSWSRINDPFYDTVAGASLDTGAGGYSNLPTTGKVAYYNSVVTGGNSNGVYRQIVTLEANTEYVMSGYFWNNSLVTHGTSRNIVIDMSDQPNTTDELQYVLSGNNANGPSGVFIYDTFNTAVTGTDVNVRIFSQPTNFLTADQQIGVWDNVAFTKASEFTAPILIPEPSSTALLGMTGMLALLRRRRG